jgi:hypothetical protein
MITFRRLRFESASRMLFESVLIVISVALGFVVTEWRQQTADRHLRDSVLQNVRTEVQGNLAQVERQIGRHQAMITAFDAVDPTNSSQSAWDIALGIMRQMGGGLETLPLQRAAWDAGVSSGALRLMDYPIAASLSEIYASQDSYSRLVEQTVPNIYTPDTFRPGSRRESLQVIRWMIAEVEGRERAVRDTYKRHLPRLQAAIVR